MKKAILFIVISSFIVLSCATSPEQDPDLDLTEQAYEAIVNGDFPEAEALLEVALSINPDNPFAILNMGVVYQNTGRIEKAREMYVKIILLNSQEKNLKSNVKGMEGKSLVDIAKRNLENL